MKHAVVGIVKGLAADLVGTGVTAVRGLPGGDANRMLRRPPRSTALDVADVVAHQLIRRLIEPDEIAATISFCCSLEGAVLNGSVVHADGGFPA